MARLLPPDAAGLRRATRAATREEALGHVRGVAGMVVARMAEEGAPVPDATAGDVPASGERVEVVITVGAPIPRGGRPPPYTTGPIS